MKKLLFSSVLVASLASFSFGADLLASLTNGKISDNGPGVKVLSLEEAKQVKGGYIAKTLQLSQNEWAVFAIPFNIQELYSNISIGNGVLNLNITPFGQEYRKALAHIYDVNDFNGRGIAETLLLPMNNILGYTVKNNISSNRGQTYNYFTYRVVLYDTNLNTVHDITSSSLLSNNLIIKELAQDYKKSFEAKFGGLKIR